MSSHRKRLNIKNRIEESDIPIEGREPLKRLCQMVFDDDCGELKNIRVAWEVPDQNAGRSAPRDDWRIYECDVLGLRFSVPCGTPIPMILAEEHTPDGDVLSVVYRFVHPDFLTNTDALLDNLVQHLQDEIQDRLASLSTTYNLVTALHDMETLPIETSAPESVARTNDRGYERIDESPLEGKA
ncbi:hypothetical protein CRI94_15375 [Longibacter salinarum]|uniref:Uncharacterized protein n=1 Tax=Longibacter salinarum TaxID=1850348 RepID=A0A2A8CUA0_9BACT|nr:hypothetical protein [Longibacter salinarum]PEN11415.1 hypothetical protein CRI94_15375 [Longibacter salinarum]